MVELALPIFALVFALGSAAASFALRPERRIKRLLRKLKPTPIGKVGDGRVVKIVGEVVLTGHAIPSPLSQRACAFYSVVVETWSTHGTQRRWGEIVREEQGIDFLVRDATGTALVRIAGESRLFSALVQDRRARISPVLNDDPDLRRFMAARNLARNNLRAHEGILAAGERVAVGGLARWEPDPDAGGGSYREASKRLVLQASESLPLFLSDDPSAL